MPSLWFDKLTTNGIGNADYGKGVLVLLCFARQDANGLTGATVTAEELVRRLGL